MSVRVLVSGAFDPLHEGHLKFLRTAANIGTLTVAVNSDKYVIQKKGAVLLPRETRAEIIGSLRFVYDVLYTWTDNDGSSLEAIRIFHSRTSPQDTIIFANGGDVTPTSCNIKEFHYCTHRGISMLFGVGGNKVNSSSNLLKEYFSKQH